MTQGAGGAFDSLRPPSAEIVADCVHCGFCLPACPTYVLWGEEMDSPRGRILLMKAGLEGQTGLTGSVVRHFDACLGCMGCVTACPSGVRYDELIEATRAQVERRHHRSLPDRLYREAIFTIFPHPGRARAAAVAGWAYQRLGLAEQVRRRGLLDRLPARVRALDGLLPPVRLASLVRPVPARVPAVGKPRLRVGLLTGCIQRAFFADVNAATARVLAAEGCEVVAPRHQGCCGALMVHAGRERDAQRSARSVVDAFEGTGVDAVVVNAAGCGSTLKEYGRLLVDDPEYARRGAELAAKARDVTEVLAELEPRAPRHPVAARVAYHDACHLAHAQGIRLPPRQVLASVPGIELVELGDDLCCGSAGIYNLVEPEAAEELGRRKAALVREAAVDALATANPGCLLQLRRHLGPAPPLFHPVELVDASIRGRDPLGRPAAAGPPAAAG
ncbi:MAG: (Fe-S)-binding protein [Acidimicrobiales bacterium]